MSNEQDDLMKYLPAVVVAVLVAVGIAALLQRKSKPRSFRDDPIGALKDHSEIVASKAQDATEEALSRVQDALEEIRGRLPEVNRKQINKRSKQINKDLNNRIAALSDQAQTLLKELRANSPIG